jgi:indoleamine 2,3-dioxygenase
MYLSGTNKKEYFPNGLILEGIDNKFEYIGGSAAQSTLIQTYDIFFSVKHDGHAKEFLEKMREYMPEKHKKFLITMESHYKIIDYINFHNDDDLLHIYNICVKNLAKFRASHMSLVHNYIFKFTNKKINSENNVNQNKGTGGTDPAVFLSATLNNTKKSITHIKPIYKQTQKKRNYFFFSLFILVFICYITFLLLK